MVKSLYTNSPLGPARWAWAITPNDGADLMAGTKSLFVGTGGTVVVMMRDGTSVTFKNVASGQQIDIDVQRVLATGTTAADIVGLG
jgi:hypothetical protein